LTCSLDALLKRSSEILQLPSASSRSVTSLQNWTNSTGSISRRETAFLNDEKADLCAVAGDQRNGIAQVESLLESAFVMCQRSPLREPRLYLFEGRTLRIITHCCVTILIVLLLLVPILVLRNTSNVALQMVCIGMMAILFTVIMSGPMKARTAEIFGASATYDTSLSSSSLSLILLSFSSIPF
jgi:hypothetical protein